MPTLTEKRWRVLKLLGLRLEKLEAVPRLQVADRQAYERLLNAQATARLVKLARTRSDRLRDIDKASGRVAKARFDKP